MHRLLLKNNTHTRLDIIDCHEIIIPLWVIMLYGLGRMGRHGHWWNPLLLFHGKTNRLCSVDSEQIVKAILLCKQSVIRLPAFFAMYRLALALAIHPLHLIRNCSLKRVLSCPTRCALPLMTYSLSSFQLGVMGSSTLGKAASLDALLNECIHGFGEWHRPSGVLKVPYSLHCN